MAAIDFEPEVAAQPIDFQPEAPAKIDFQPEPNLAEIQRQSDPFAPSTLPSTATAAQRLNDLSNRTALLNSWHSAATQMAGDDDAKQNAIQQQYATQRDKLNTEADAGNISFRISKTDAENIQDQVKAASMKPADLAGVIGDRAAKIVAPVVSGVAQVAGGAIDPDNAPLMVLPGVLPEKLGVAALRAMSAQMAVQGVTQTAKAIKSGSGADAVAGVLTGALGALGLKAPVGVAGEIPEPETVPAAATPEASGIDFEPETKTDAAPATEINFVPEESPPAEVLPANSEPVQTPGSESPAATPPGVPATADSEIPLLPVDVTDAQIKGMRLPAAERAPDILDIIGDHFPNGVQFADKADFGDYLNTAQGAAKELMSHTAGEPADKVLDGLHLEGQYQHLDSVDDLAQAMVDAGKSRIGERAGANDQARELAQDQMRQQLFDTANKAGRAGAEAVPVENLFVGDTFKLNGQPMKVTGFATDADTGKPFGVELNGAYGQRTVPVGKALHLDEGTLQAAIPSEGGRVAASGTSVPRQNQIDTPQFKNWFGESQVVDKTGKAIRVFHGTSNAGFDQFDPYASNYGLMGDGSYFTENPEVASSYTKKGKGQQEGVYPVYLKIVNPLDFDAPADIGKWTKAAPDVDFSGVKTNEDALRKLEENLTEQGLPKWEGTEQVNGTIRSMGFDGGTHLGGGRVQSGSTKHRVWITLDPEQIKSASGNNGNFDPENPRISAAGTSRPQTTPQKIQVPPTVAATPAPATHPIGQYFATHANNIKSAIAPQALAGAQDVANALRHFMGENATARARADEALKPFHADFDKTPVPANYRYNPNQPLPHNYAIIDAMERDPKSLPARYQQLAATFQKEFAWRIDAIQKFAPDALQKLITNYFPHVWEDPKRAEGVMAQTATRLFAGRKEFLKQRSLPFFRDGLERGLKPVSDNPVDLLLAKMDSMDKMLLALKAQSEFKKSGAMKFNYALEKTPDGWVKVNDPSFVVNTPPEVTVKEAFDAELRTKTQEFLKKLGVPEKRLATLGGQRWGLAYESPEQIKTRFGGPMSVYWHELGHIIDFRYNLQKDFLDQGKSFDQELRNLADRRLPANYPKTRAVLNKQTGRVVNRPNSMVSYVRNNEEKMAVMSEAYVHAPEVFKRVAPAVYAKFDNFIDAHPELQDIRNIKPSLRLDTAETTHKLGGILKLGDWIMPEGPAQVMKNYLSPGLARNSLYRSFKSASNILNAAQLGLSGFHLGFTSLDAATSRLAIGIEDAANGNLLRAGKTFASVPLSPVTNILKGRRIREEALHPGSTDADTAALVKALEQAGGRIGADKFWQTDFTRRLKVAFGQMRQSFNSLDPYHAAKAGAKAAWNAPFSAVELAMKPIMDYIVPRQKLGVFADMAQRELERLGPNASLEETREAMRKAWDSVDNRMGQVVYDNLFYNRMAKDMALASFRAYGWQLGKYREGFGALADTAAAGKQAISGERPAVSHRMAYALALPLMVGAIGGTMNYLMTGQSPKEWRDWFMPRTGSVDANGNPSRLNLPSYMKDVLAYAKHPATSLAHSLNPIFSGMYDLLENKDFYGTQIRDPDDPLWKQGSDVAKYAGKQFVPFSVSGTMQLHEQAAPIQKEILPFFGITPVPTRMTMTPAQELAAEITGANMPDAPRTKEQFDRSKLIKEIVQDFKNGQNTAGQSRMAQGFQTGQLNANNTQTIIDRLKFTPLQFQIHHMDVPAAMRVWRVANPQERTQLGPMINLKVAASKTLTPDEMRHFTAELHAK